MKQLLTNAFYSYRLALDLARSNNETADFHRLAQRTCAALIAESKALNDGSVSDRTYKKIQWYKVSNFFMGRQLSWLLSEEISPTRHGQFFCLGAIMGLGDILVDDYGYTHEKLQAMFEVSHEPDTAIAKILHLYYRWLLQNTEESVHQPLLELLREGCYWQAKSIEQLPEHTLAAQDVQAITEGKGGLSILLCAALFCSFRPAQHRAALFELGALVQYMNDAQDLYKDACAGIHTFVWDCQNFKEVQSFLEEKKKNCLHKILQTSWSASRNAPYIAFCFHAMHVGVSFKLWCYAAQWGEKPLNIKVVAAQPPHSFKVALVSLKAIKYVVPKVLGFSEKDYL